MIPTFGRNIIPRKRLSLPLAILILLSYLSTTTIDFANVAIAEDYNEDNFRQDGDSSIDNIALSTRISLPIIPLRTRY